MKRYAVAQIRLGFAPLLLSVLSLAPVHLAQAEIRPISRGCVSYLLGQFFPRLPPDSLTGRADYRAGLLHIVKLGAPDADVLREKTKHVARDEILSREFQDLVDDMWETLQDSGGIGLAAPQVGVSLRIAIVDLGGAAPEVLINPRMTPLSERTRVGLEGCLSIPRRLIRVRRFRKIRVDYEDLRGEPQTLIASGFPAVIVQHELDHLDGVLTLDRTIP